MVIATWADPVPPALIAFTVTDIVPATVGVPLIVLADRVSPAGRLLVLYDVGEFVAVMT